MHDLREEAKDMREEAARLEAKADRLDAGEELCNHHWSGDPEYEGYCTGCDRWIGGYSSSEIPLKSDAYCHQCQKSPEQKKKEQGEEEAEQMENELEMLAELQAKYPDKTAKFILHPQG